MPLKAFRLFISSTFADFAAEREVLHEQVFPAVERYCLERSYQFHPIDLRWGVSEEAQLDQKTVALCLNAVKASKRFPPPNFLIMLGNRYGWVPLPYAIECGEFEAICQAIEQNGNAKAPEIIENLRKLYLLDANYLVESIPGEMVPAHILIHRQGALADQQKWQAIETFYRPHLQMAADRLFHEGQLDAPKHDKYFSSLTEQEIYNGLDKIDNDQSFAFLREIRGGTTKTAPDFIEDNPRLDKLKTYIKGTLPPELIFSVETTAHAAGLDEHYLAGFADQVEAFLKSSIDTYIKQVEETEQVPDHELVFERGQHKNFRDEKLEIFFGREDTLRVIDYYLDAPVEDVAITGAPLIIHGRSGFGKSALMAKTIKMAQDRRTVPVIYRFVGASAASSDIRSLLISLVEDLAAHGLTQKPDEFETDINKFNIQISELLSSIEQPVTIFIDALDQLQKQDFLNWLPAELHKKMRLVLSVLHDEDYPEASRYFRILARKYADENFLQIEGLDTDHGTNMLAALLDDASRKLQPEQFHYLLDKFKAAGASPLYLKLAFEITGSWHGWDIADKKENDMLGRKTLAADVPALVAQFFSELVSKHHHAPKLVARVQGYLAAARFGLSEKEIYDIISRDDEVMAAVANEYHENKSGKVPASVWTRLESQLSAFLVEKQIDGQPLLHFFHRQITDAVISLYYEAEKQLLHEKLAAYFDSLNQQEGERTRYNIRTLSELPYQLHENVDVESLKSILLDPAFMEDRLAAHDIQPLIEDFRAYGDEAGRAAKLTGKALELIAPIIARDPQQLLPQLLGRLMADDRMMDARENEKLTQMLDKARGLIKPPALISRWSSFTQAGGPETRRFEGHTSQISAVAFSPDGRTIATGSLDHTLRLWDMETSCSRVFKAHTDLVNAIAFSPDGRTIASGSWDTTLRIWDVETGHSYTLEGHSESVNAVTFSPDGHTIASGSDDMTLRLWDVETSNSRIFQGHTDTITAIAYSPDGRTIVSGSQDKTLRLWNVQTGHSQMLVGHTDRVLAVAFNPDGRTIVSGSWDTTLRLWDAETRHSRILDGRTSKITAVAISPDGQTIVSGSDDRMLRLWDVEAGLSHTLEAHTDWVTAVTFSPDGRTIASGAGDDVLRLWDVEINKPHMLKAHTNWVTAVALSPDGRTIVSGSKDKTLRLWDVETGHSHVIKGDTRQISAVAFSPDGRTIISGSWDKMLLLWDVKTGHSRALEGHTSSVRAVAFSPNGRFIASGSQDKTLRLWNVETGFSHSLEGHEHSVTAVAFSPDGQTIVSCSDDRTLRLWDVDTGHSRIFKGHVSSVATVTFSPDGRTIASGSLDKTLLLWDVTTGHSHLLKSHTGRVTAVIFSPDGRSIISSSWDKTLRFWDVKTRQELARFDGDSFFLTLAINRHVLIAGDHGGGVHLFDILLNKADKQAWLKRHKKEHKHNEEKWYLARGDKRFGPMTVAQLWQMKQSAQLLPTDLVWRKGLKNWVHADQIKWKS